MKRALVGIVPAEILTKRQKCLTLAEPGEAEYPNLGEISEYIVSAVGIVDSNKLMDALRKLQCKKESQVANLMRTLALEAWLRHVKARGVLSVLDAQRTPDLSVLSKRNFHHPFKPRSAS
jgi:hypothetical protein